MRPRNYTDSPPTAHAAHAPRAHLCGDCLLSDDALALKAGGLGGGERKAWRAVRAWEGSGEGGGRHEGALHARTHTHARRLADARRPTHPPTHLARVLCGGLGLHLGLSQLALHPPLHHLPMGVCGHVGVQVRVCMCVCMCARDNRAPPPPPPPSPRCQLSSAHHGLGLDRLGRQLGLRRLAQLLLPAGACVCGGGAVVRGWVDVPAASTHALHTHTHTKNPTHLLCSGATVPCTISSARFWAWMASRSSPSASCCCRGVGGWVGGWWWWWSVGGGGWGAVCVGGCSLVWVGGGGRTTWEGRVCLRGLGRGAGSSCAPARIPPPHTHSSPATGATPPRTFAPPGGWARGPRWPPGRQAGGGGGGGGPARGGEGAAQGWARGRGVGRGAGAAAATARAAGQGAGSALAIGGQQRPARLLGTLTRGL